MEVAIGMINGIHKGMNVDDQYPLRVARAKSEGTVRGLVDSLCCLILSAHGIAVLRRTFLPMKSKSIVTVKYIRFFIFLLLLVISGCSVLQNSETFYRDHPPGPIRWHEYED